MKTIVLFDEFELPIIKGMEYLVNDKIISSDYLFINELNDFHKITNYIFLPKIFRKNYC